MDRPFFCLDGKRKFGIRFTMEEGISRKEAEEFYEKEGKDLLSLVALGSEAREKFHGKRIDLCSIVNAKSGACEEDCKFCAQSGRYFTDIPEHPLLSIDELISRAVASEKSGAKNFCIVTSGRGVSDKDFNSICEAFRKIREKTSLEFDCSLGTLTKERAIKLKKIGIARYNHNLETSRRYFPNICTTHTYDDRISTLKILKDVGIARCSGGIIGLGETRPDRLDLAFTLKELGVECVTLNILNPRPGTPLEDIAPLDPFEIIKTIAIFRLIMPRAILKLAGGREKNLRDLQGLGILAGANGMIIGGYLTTKGRSVEDDLQMIKDLGLEAKWT